MPILKPKSRLQRDGAPRDDDAFDGSFQKPQREPSTPEPEPEFTKVGPIHGTSFGGREDTAAGPDSPGGRPGGGSSMTARVQPKTPTSAALTGGNVSGPQSGGGSFGGGLVQPRGGGSFDSQPGLARSMSSRPTFGTLQGLTGGGIGVPGMEQTGSETQMSPLLLALLQKLQGGR